MTKKTKKKTTKAKAKPKAPALIDYLDLRTGHLTQDIAGADIRGSGLCAVPAEHVDHMRTLQRTKRRGVCVALASAKDDEAKANIWNTLPPLGDDAPKAD